MSNERCPTDAQLLRVELAAPGPELERHLTECDSCRERWAALHQLAALGTAIGPQAPMASARREAIRDDLLARATGNAPVLPKSRWSRTWAVAAAAVILIASAAAMWLSSKPPASPVAQPATYRGTVRPTDDARFVRLSASPDEVVRLFDGTITVEVDPLREGERFRVVTNDGEVEVHGTIFDVEARDDHLVRVAVTRGEVAVRGSGVPPGVVLRPMQSWHAEPEAPSRTPVDTPIAIVGPEQPPADADVPSPPQPHSRPRPSRPAPEGPVVVEETPKPPLVRKTPSPTELRYQDGWGALRANDFSRAISSFESVLADPKSPLAEDAAYWRAVALGRADRDPEAVVALRAYIARYPTSTKIDEAQAMLGWLLIEMQDEAGARQAFEAAAKSPVQHIRENAQRGLSKLNPPARTPQ